MKHRMLKTEIVHKVFKELGECIKNGTRTLNMKGMDESGKRKVKKIEMINRLQAMGLEMKEQKQ